MVDILYAKAIRRKETHGDDRTSNQLSYGNTVGAEINSAKKDLPALCLNDYSAFVAPYWATGRSNPCNTKATIDAESVFFIVHANVLASFYLAADARESMVAQKGQSSDWPVSFVAGIATPVWATTHERSNSGGSNIRYTKEVDAMSSAPTPARTKFTDIYWIIPLYSNIPHGKVAFTRQEARLFRVMFKDSRLIWAGRKTVHEGVEEISIPQSRGNISHLQPSRESLQFRGWRMSNFVAIQNTAMSVVEYQGKSVVTFATIDKVHGRTKGTAKRAFNVHRSHFVCDEDYVLLPASLKNEFRTLGISVPNRGLTALTESGYLLIVKSFTDAFSWDVQKQLVNIYFRRNNLGELRHVELHSLEELSQIPPEKAQHIVPKAEKESSYRHGKPGSAAITLRRKELKQIRPATKLLISLHQLSLCDLGDFSKGGPHA